MRATSLLALLILPTAAIAQMDPVARVDSVFATWRTAGAPGCAVGVAENGRPVLRRAYGLADLEHEVPNTPQTVFEAGSVSKQFTAAAAVLLAKQGKLSLDDDVRRYIPEVPDYATTITIRHLLNHTSGLRDWGSVQDIAGSPRGTRIHTHAHVLDIVSRQRALNFAPGAEYLYSNTGYNLLAILVERVSGTSFAEFSNREIFTPLGMTSTQWRDDFSRVVKGRAQAYDHRDGAYHLEMPFENVHGNGGLLTTVDDLLRWNEALTSGALGGVRDELQTQGRLTGGRQIEYALGLRVAPYRGVDEVSHSGSTAGYRAYLARYPRQVRAVSRRRTAAWTRCRTADRRRDTARTWRATHGRRCPSPCCATWRRPIPRCWPTARRRCSWAPTCATPRRPRRSPFRRRSWSATPASSAAAARASRCRWSWRMAR